MDKNKTRQSDLPNEVGSDAHHTERDGVDAARGNPQTLHLTTGNDLRSPGPASWGGHPTQRTRHPKQQQGAAPSSREGPQNIHPVRNPTCGIFV